MSRLRAKATTSCLVCGFFILFENTYLVGDTIEIGNAKGIVEGIDFRTTKIRDDEGRLHVIRNGETKPVINYSKDYTRAVVAVDVSYDADLRNVFSTLRQAGERLRARHTLIPDARTLRRVGVYARTAQRLRP